MKTSRGKRLTDKKGFTFLEMMLVILLLGFMFLFTWPNFQGFTSRGNTRQGILELTGALRFAHSQAATTKCRYRVNLDIRENTFWISKEKDKKEFLVVSSPYGQRTHLPPGLVFLDIQQPHRGKIREGTGHVEFSPTGWAKDCTIHLRRGEEDIFTIFVYPLGGKVEIISGYVEKAIG